MFAWREHEMSKKSPRWDPTDPKARSKYDGIIKNHLIPHFKQRPFESITAEELENYLSELFKAHSSYATSLRAWVKGALMFAEREGLCTNLNIESSTFYRKTKRPQSTD